MVDYTRPEEEWSSTERALQQTLHELLSLGIQTTRTEGTKLEGAGDPVYGDIPAGLVGSTFRSVLNELENLYRLSEQDERQTLIPANILDVIDKANNPALFTRELVERASSENQYANAGIENLKNYHNLLVEQVKKEFPALEQPLDEYQQQQNTDPIKTE